MRTDERRSPVSLPESDGCSDRDSPEVTDESVEEVSLQQGDTDGAEDTVTPEPPAHNTPTGELKEESQPSTSAAPALDHPQQSNEEKEQEDERDRMTVLVSSFSEDQLNRYEMYRRAAFSKASIKRLVQSISGAPVTQNVAIAISGLAKVFVGEIVEKALECKEQTGEADSERPIQPKHIREAARRLRRAQNMPKQTRAHPYFR